MFDFTNYRDHPTNSSFIVYHFYRPEQADYFEALARAEGLEYERHNETEENRPVYYFAVSKSLLKTAQRVNHLAVGKFRSPFIPNRTLGWVMIIGSLLVIALSIIGYLVS